MSKSTMRPDGLAYRYRRVAVSADIAGNASTTEKGTGSRRAETIEESPFPTLTTTVFTPPSAGGGTPLRRTQRAPKDRDWIRYLLIVGAILVSAVGMALLFVGFTSEDSNARPTPTAGTRGGNRSGPPRTLFIAIGSSLLGFGGVVLLATFLWFRWRKR